MKPLLLLLFAAPLYAQAPFPGYWHCGSAAPQPAAPMTVAEQAASAAIHYCPCSIPPYTKWTDPETGQVAFRRYDFSAMGFPQGCPGLGGDPPCLYTGSGGYAHTQTWLSLTFYEMPMQKQPPVDGFYPAPPADAGLCDQWHAAGNTGACPGTNYESRMASNPAWVTGYNYYKPFINADPGCQGGGGPTATRTATPAPVPTQTPSPSIYGRHITWAYDHRIVVGCGNGMFCPGTPVSGLVTRAQLCVYVYNAYLLDHPNEPLPACRAIFSDVVCP